MIDNKVSIITIVFNRSQQIEATLQSVVNQAYSNTEYIVIDGGSTDGTVDIIKKYEKNLTRWISEPDKGIYDAMNKGIDLATGEWIIFIHAGDQFYSADVLNNVFNREYKSEIIYGNGLVDYGSFKLMWRKMPLHEMWKRTPFCHQACFVRANLLKQSRFNITYRLSSDFDFLYNAFLSRKVFEEIDNTICIYDNTGGASKSHELRSFNERWQIVMSKGFSFAKWLYYFRCWTYLIITLAVKNVLGKKVTTWVTRFLKM